MSTATAANVIEILKLANNGYTYEASIPLEYRAKLIELVESGVVIMRDCRHPARRQLTTNIYILAINYAEVVRSMRHPH